MAHDTHAPDSGRHPDAELLEKFMRNEAEPAERRWIVRHLIAGCPRCLAVTSELWALGDLPAGARSARVRPETSRQGSGEPRAGGASAAGAAEVYTGLFERLAEVGERVEAEREQAPRRVAELLAMPPAERAALLARDAGGAGPAAALPWRAGPFGGGGPAAGAGRRFITPPVCQLLLERSREAAPVDPRVAAEAAELALAIGERLDEAECGAAVVRGLRARSWGHLGHARRLGGDLDGAEWALAFAEALAVGESGDGGGAGEWDAAGGGAGERGEVGGGAREEGDAAALDETGRGREDGRAEALARTAGAAETAGFEPAEWAELLLFKAGLHADRGELGAADRLLGRAAKLFRSAGETHRAGIALAEQGSIRAELGDRRRAAELLRAGIDLLDLAAAPRLVAATLCRLAELVGGVWPAWLDPAPEGSDAAAVGWDAAPAGSDAPTPESTGPVGISTAPASVPAPPPGSSDPVGIPGAPVSAPALPPGSTGAAGIPAAPSGSVAPGSIPAAASGSTTPPMAPDPAGPAAAQTGHAAAGAGWWRRGAEALQLLGRSRALYKGLGDGAAEARLLRSQGQIEAALGRLDEAEATLRTALAALARHGLGREASRVRAELAMVLARQGREDEVRQVGRELRPPLLARDQSPIWRWGALAFEIAAYRYGDDADAKGVDAKLDVGLVAVLARYLAVPQLPAAVQGHGRRASPRLTRVA